MSWLSTTWFRFLLRLGSFFGKHLNEARKGVSDLESYNTTLFVRSNEDARVGTCKSTCPSQETPWRGDGHAGRSQSRGTSRRKAWDSQSTAFPKRNSSFQTLVLWSASNNEILKNSWQENIQNRNKALGSNPGPMTPCLRYPGTDIFKSLPPPPPQVILPPCRLH